MTGTSGPTTISTKQRRIAELARAAPDMVFSTLAHHIDLDWMREAYRRTRKDGAVGVDGTTAAEYAQNLEGNLREASLHDIWVRQGAFGFNRDFTIDQLEGFCAVCRYKDICRGGCAWTAYRHTSNRFDNPYCFYRQALLHDRLDLLGEDEPGEEELAAIAKEREAAKADGSA